MKTSTKGHYSFWLITVVAVPADLSIIMLTTPYHHLLPGIENTAAIVTVTKQATYYHNNIITKVVEESETSRMCVYFWGSWPCSPHTEGTWNRMYFRLQLISCLEYKYGHRR